MEFPAFSALFLLTSDLVHVIHVCTRGWSAGPLSVGGRAVDVLGFRTNATPFFIRPAVPPSRSVHDVIGSGIQCLVLRLFSVFVLIKVLHPFFFFFCLNCYYSTFRMQLAYLKKKKKQRQHFKRLMESV